MKDNKSPKKKSGRNTGKKPVNDKKSGSGSPKSEVDNQWTSATAGCAENPNEGEQQERRDGPGGEDG